MVVGVLCYGLPVTCRFACRRFENIRMLLEREEGEGGGGGRGGGKGGEQGGRQRGGYGKMMAD